MLEVTDLHAYYGKSHVLHGVSFGVGPGEIGALLGRNGSGKTSLVALIARLYDPSEGAVLGDGADLRAVDLALVDEVLGPWVWDRPLTDDERTALRRVKVRVEREPITDRNRGDALEALDGASPGVGAGTAAQQAGNSAEATRYYEMAAAFPEYFYGLLALERLGRPASPAAAPPVQPTPEQRARLHDLRQAAADGAGRPGGRARRHCAGGLANGGERRGDRSAAPPARCRLGRGRCLRGRRRLRSRGAQTQTLVLGAGTTAPR